MSQNMKALKWQLIQNKLSVLKPSFITLAENFGKWRPYLELIWGEGTGGRNFTGAAAPWPPLEPPLYAPAKGPGHFWWINF